MPLQTSGSITLNDIAAEFGGTAPHSLNEYYAGGPLVPSGTSGINGAIPSSGTITLNQFYGAGASDPYWKYVSLLLHGNGTDNSNNATVIDSSSGTLAVTRNGNVAMGTFSPYGADWSTHFSGGSLLCEGNGLRFYSSDFTIEGWVYIMDPSPGGTNQNSVFQLSYAYTNSTLSGSITLQLPGTRVWRLTLGDGVNRDTTITHKFNTWHHFAIVRSGTTTTLYIDGTSQISVSDTNSYNVGYLTLGKYWYLPMKGFISNFRVVKGTAVYTADFTPPTSPLIAITNTTLLTCNSNRILDSSSSNLTIVKQNNYSDLTTVTRFSPFNGPDAYSTSVNGGSLYFPNELQGGSNHFYEYPNSLYVSSPDVNLSGTTYTIETWFYVTDEAAESWPSEGMPLFNWWNAFNDRWGFIVAFGPNYHGLHIWTDGPATGTSFPGTINRYVWNHAAAVWDGTNTNIYLNGILIGTLNANYARNISNLYIGRTRYNYGGYIGDVSGFTGLMADIRITKSVVYTGNFTPPTAPLTALANTKLLIRGNTNVIDHAAAEQNYIYTQGDAKLSTVDKKFGTASILLDGTGDWLELPKPPGVESTANNQMLVSRNFYQGDFTIEAFIKITGHSALNNSNQRAAAIVTCINPGYQEYSWEFTVEGDSSTTGIGMDFTVWRFGGTRKVNTTNTPLSLNTWHHVAVTQAGGTARIFLNGTVIATATGFGADWPCLSNQPIRVGRAAVNGYLHEFCGYIDDLRITNGVARYTGNFTVPTSEFLNR